MKKAVSHNRSTTSSTTEPTSSPNKKQVRKTGTTSETKKKRQKKSKTNESATSKQKNRHKRKKGEQENRTAEPLECAPVDRASEEKQSAEQIPISFDSSSEELTDDQQRLLLQWLSRGASPTAACQQLGISVRQYMTTRENCPLFRDQESQVQFLLSQNVAAALYQAAMKGSVSAQTFWLKAQPPPGWVKRNESDERETDPLETLDDEELIQLARSMGIALPSEFAFEIEEANDETFSASVSSVTRPSQ